MLGKFCGNCARTAFIILCLWVLQFHRELLLYSVSGSLLFVQRNCISFISGVARTVPTRKITPSRMQNGIPPRDWCTRPRNCIGFSSYISPENAIMAAATRVSMVCCRLNGGVRKLQFEVLPLPNANKSPPCR